jgi:hypothetical protein
MTRPDPDDLEAFVAGLDAATLSSVLIELARDVEAVRKRLDRLRLASQPKSLAAAFKATLIGWRRATHFIGYRDSHAFGGELEGWLGQIERELVPRDPQAALALVETFIESDAKSSSEPTIPTAPSAMRCARRAGSGYVRLRYANRRLKAGPHDCSNWPTPTNTAHGTSCCAARTCCSTGKLCGRWSIASTRS